MDNVRFVQFGQRNGRPHERVPEDQDRDLKIEAAIAAGLDADTLAESEPLPHVDEKKLAFLNEIMSQALGKNWDGSLD